MDNKIEVNAQTTAARIIGSRKGSVCDIHVVWPPNAALAQMESRDRSDHAIIAATTRAVNPRFVTILTARSADEKPIIVTTEGHPETRHTLRLTYPDGSVKAMTIHHADISLK